MAYRFNAPLTWPQPPAGWVPPQDWKPDPSWPPAPPGWQFWQDTEPQPQAGWTQPPTNPAPVYQPAVTRPIPAAQAVDSRLQAVVASYVKRGYKVVSHQGSTVTLQRAATSFEWIWLIGSFIIGVGIGGLIYVALWLLWRVPRSYSVDLSLNEYGQVIELGDTLAVFDRDRLKSGRVRSWIFGVLLALFALLMVGGLFTSTPTGEDRISTIITIIVVTGACAAGAFLLLRTAMEATRKLRAP